MSEGAVGVLLAVGALGVLLNMRPREESVFIGAAGCGGLTGATLAACQKAQKPKPKPPVGATGSGQKGITIRKTPLVTKKQSSGSSSPGAGSGQSKPSPSNRSGPAPKGSVSGDEIRRRNAEIKRRNAIIIKQWVAIAKARIIARLRARLRALQSGRIIRVAGTLDPTVGQINGALGSLYDPNTPFFSPWNSQRIAKMYSDAKKKCGTDKPTGVTQAQKDCFYNVEQPKIDAQLEHEELARARRRSPMTRHPGEAQPETDPGPGHKEPLSYPRY